MESTKTILLIGLAFTACKKPYNPPVIAAAGSYLVVEGVINAGADSTNITLSRTVKLDATRVTNPERRATVTIESDGNESYPLTEITGGHYVTAGLNLGLNHNYRLRISTAGNEQYLSDFVPVKVTPSIDSIGFNVSTTPDTGMQVYVNTHDNKNNTHYYRWDYQETWAFHSKYVSLFYSDYTKIWPRDPSQFVTFCYRSDTSSSITLGSSAQLEQDVIYKGPILKIPSTSEKLETKYSILLRQYALTGDAYNFWRNIKKNTEQLGSIFDALPSQAGSNIHCTSNPAQPVIGYVSVTTVQSKRVYLLNSQVPDTWVPDYPYHCDLDSGLIGKPKILNLIQNPEIWLPTDAVGSYQNPIGYFFTTRACADCTVRGSLIPPPFWR